MPRPITLFTGQWADLTFDTVCAKAKAFGYDGVEIACWGDHFEVDKALSSDKYIRNRWDIMEKHGLKCFAISNHLVGQAVCDRIDERHKSILPDRIWGDGKEDGVRARAAEEMKNTARAAAKMGLKLVPGFTGSPIWHMVYSFPPNPSDYLEKGLKLFAEMWTPILDVFQAEGVKFGLEVHPTEIAFDIASAENALNAVKGHPAFGFNYDPSHFGYQGVDYVAFIRHVRRPHLPRAHEGCVVVVEADRGRRLWRASQFRRSAPLLGLPLAGPRLDQLRGDHPRAERHRLLGAALGRMGRRQDGSRARRDRSRCVPAASGLRAVGRCVRCGIRV